MKEQNKAYYRKLGIKIAYYRNQRDLTQKEVADKLDTEPSNVSRIEKGNVGLSLDMIIAIAEALDVPLHLLFDFRDLLDDVK